MPSFVRMVKKRSMMYAITNLNASHDAAIKTLKNALHLSIAYRSVRLTQIAPLNAAVSDTVLQKIHVQ